MLYLIGQVVTDPWAAWGTLILQGGAFGLLSIVTLWLVPKELNSQRAEREKRDQRMEAVTSAFATTLTEVVNTLQDKFAERNDRVVDTLERQTQRFEIALKDSAARIEAAVRQHP